MKVHLCLTAFTVTFVIIITCSGLHAQGELTPPGAPGETMKTLDQVEPRTPISSLPYTISEPGSYYVTGNLSSTEDGIVIESSDVTVDLMGFSLTGDGDADDNGIQVDGSAVAPIENLVITGGRISGFYFGLFCNYMNNSRIKGLVVSGNTDQGVYFYGRFGGQCNGNTIADCTISDNGGIGILLNGNQEGKCNGNTITDSTISGNEDEGLDLKGSYSGQCNGNTIADCTISDNGAKGLDLDGSQSGQCNGNTISDCTISGNGDEGVSLYGDSGQCDGNTISDSTISGNGDEGVLLWGRIGQCDGNTIRENTVSKNVNRGIFLYKADGNRVEANHVWGTTGAASYGIRTDPDTTGNFILKNTCVGQVNNFTLDIDDTYGPVVSSSGALAGTNPWANFSR